MVVTVVVVSLALEVTIVVAALVLVVTMIVVVVAALVLVVTMVVVVAVAVVAVDTLNLEEVDLMASSLSQRGRVLRNNSSLPTQHRAITNTSMFSSHKQVIALIIIIIIFIYKV